MSLNRLFCLSIFACFLNLTGQTQAQIIAKGEQCAPSQERLTALRQERQGVFRALRLAVDPLYLGNLQFRDDKDNRKRLADFAGKMLLVNLWGVWCPPCRAEIPDLAELQEKMGGKDFAVLAIYDQASSREKVRAFLQEHKAENLPLYRDSTMDFYENLKREGLARGLPVSLLIDARGCLIASLNGGVNWASPDALNFIKAAQKP